jgi:hypothetical protein
MSNQYKQPVLDDVPEIAPRPQSWLQKTKSVGELVEILWMPGLALAILLSGSLLFLDLKVVQLPGKLSYWLVYLVLGSLFPVLVLFVLYADKFIKRLVSPLWLIKSCLAVFFVVTAGWFALVNFQLYILLFLAIQLAVTYILSQRGYSPFWLWVGTLFFYSIIIFNSWIIFREVLHWQPFERASFITITNGVIFLAVLLLAAKVLLPLERKSEQALEGSRFSPVFDRDSIQTYFASRSNLLNLLGIFGLGLLSLRADGLLTHPSAEFHWAFFAGPAELVRQGGWLLWDVPSLYGYLNIVLVAALPFGSTWQSLFILNAACLFVSAVCTFVIFR